MLKTIRNRGLGILIAFLIFFPLGIKAQLDSLDIKIGQLLIFGFYGQKINSNDPVYKAVKEGKIGSLLFYRRNISSQNTRQQVKKLITDFQSTAPIPLLVSIDQEGGLVNRFDSIAGFPSMPSAFYLGSQNDTSNTYSYGLTTASLLAEMGFNLNYAPVVDLHNPVCPVLGARKRCFSSNPEKVALHANQIIKAHNQQNVITMLKHFPGHGNSTTDSHFGVADVSKTWSPNELMPYKQLISTGMVHAIMTAHIVNAQLDPSLLPATLSHKILTGLLRETLHYTGPIFSDDMMMEAISKKYGVEEAIYLAINAGVDVLMFSNNIKNVANYTPNNIHKIIKTLVIKGKITPQRINESYTRVMELKKRFNLTK
jgi:beta-N-acetylhexosaminidase